MNCRLNEEKVFPSPSVFAELNKDFIEARLHTDGDRGEELSEYQESVAHSIGTPLYLVMDPTSRRILAGPLGGIVTVDQFLGFLKDAKSAARGEERVGRLDR